MTPTERAAAMWRMYEAGDTLDTIGECYGVSKQRVSQLLNNAGYTLRKGKPLHVQMQIILDYIRGYYEDNRIPPVLREISKAVYGHERGMGNLQQPIDKLIEQGYLYRVSENSARSLMLKKPQPHRKVRRGDANK